MRDEKESLDKSSPENIMTRDALCHIIFISIPSRDRAGCCRMQSRFPGNCGKAVIGNRRIGAAIIFISLSLSLSADGFPKRSPIRGLGFRDKELELSLRRRHRCTLETKVSAASLWTWFCQTYFPLSLSLSLSLSFCAFARNCIFNYSDS